MPIRTPNRQPVPRLRQRGLTVVEMMIAITLSLLLTAAVAFFYIGASRSYSEDQTTGQMIENGRFAMRFLAEDLRMSTFFGELPTPNLLTNNDCGIASTCGTFNIKVGTTPIQYWDASPSGTAPSCATGATPAPKSDTELFAIKKTAGTPTATPVATKAYVRSNGTQASLQCNVSAPLTGFRDWEYEPVVYYVNSDNQLCRMVLQDGEGSETAFGAQCLIEGVERLVVEWGIDTDATPDGRADEYIYNDDDTDLNLAKVVSARIHLLVRGTTPDNRFTDSRVYTMGPVTVTPGTTPGSPANFHRRVFSKVVQLRNPASLAVLYE